MHLEERAATIVLTSNYFSIVYLKTGLDLELFWNLNSRGMKLENHILTFVSVSTKYESIHAPAITSYNHSLYLRLLFNELLLYPIYNRNVAFTQEIEYIENPAVLNKYSAGS